jgi:hypothetical protein
MPPSAVVDASVLVSACLFADSILGRILKLAAEGGIAIHLSPILVEETRRSLLNARLTERATPFRLGRLRFRCLQHRLPTGPGSPGYAGLLAPLGCCPSMGSGFPVGSKAWVAAIP